MIERLGKDNQVIWYNPALLHEEPELVFSAQYWQQQNKVLGSAQGRGTTWFINMEMLPAALRHYRRGGLFGRLVADQYLFSGWDNTRCYAEFMLLQQLSEAGVRVPKPVAARAQKSGLIYRADIITEFVAGSQDLVSCLQKEALPAEMYQKIGAEIAKMHAAQVNHTDLNIHNILLDSQHNVWLIDFDKCSKQSGNNWQSSNIERLKRSFVKERLKRHIFWNEDDWAALLDGYQQAI